MDKDITLSLLHEPWFLLEKTMKSLKNFPLAFCAAKYCYVLKFLAIAHIIISSSPFTEKKCCMNLLERCLKETDLTVKGSFSLFSYFFSCCVESACNSRACPARLLWKLKLSLTLWSRQTGLHLWQHWEASAPTLRFSHLDLFYVRVASVPCLLKQLSFSLFFTCCWLRLNRNIHASIFCSLTGVPPLPSALVSIFITYLTECFFYSDMFHLAPTGDWSLCYGEANVLEKTVSKLLQKT